MGEGESYWTPHLPMLDLMFDPAQVSIALSARLLGRAKIRGVPQTYPKTLCGSPTGMGISPTAADASALFDGQHDLENYRAIKRLCHVFVPIGRLAQSLLLFYRRPAIDVSSPLCAVGRDISVRRAGDPKRFGRSGASAPEAERSTIRAMMQMRGTFVDRFSRFARWWTGELVGCLPEGIRAKLVPNRKKLVVLIDNDRVRLERSDGKIEANIGQLSLIGADQEDLRKAIRRIMRKARLGPRQVVFRLDRGKVLTRTVDLPIAAAENLREVLGFEMDRYTPFNATDVYYDYRIIGTHLKSKRLTVNLAVATREAVNGAIDVARLLGLEPTQIGFVSPAKSEEASFNFLRPARARSHGPIWRGITACAALAFILLLASAVYQPIKLKQDALQASEARLTRARAEAAESSRLKERLDELLEQSGFVLRQKHTLTNVTELIDEVTRLLPDDTWLLQLDLKGDALELTGFAAKSSALIEVIEGSPLLTNAHFTSPVTPDPKFEVDRFKLSAFVAQRQSK